MKCVKKTKACTTSSDLHPHTLHLRSFICLKLPSPGMQENQIPESYTVCRLLVLAVIHGAEIVQLITCLLAFCMWIKKKKERTF